MKMTKMQSVKTYTNWVSNKRLNQIKGPILFNQAITHLKEVKSNENERRTHSRCQISQWFGFLAAHTIDAAPTIVREEEW